MTNAAPRVSDALLDEELRRHWKMTACHDALLDLRDARAKIKALEAALAARDKPEVEKSEVEG